MRRIVWTAWHLLRGHLLTIGRPYDAPVGLTAHCRCGHRRQLI